MGWLVLLSLLMVAGAALAVVTVNRRRFERTGEDDARALRAVPPAPPVAGPTGALPPPVERYRRLAVGAHAPVRALRMRHAGTFRPSVDAKWLAIRGEQLFTADPPGFVWTGRVVVAPGVWIDARDELRAGKGSMHVLLDSTVHLADAEGATVDRAAALRVLAEMPWFPTALFDARYVRWSPVDADRARATLSLDGAEVSCVFEFGPDGLPVRATGERPRESGELRPWGGTYGAYRSVDGLLVPFDAEVSWELEGGTFTYAHWVLQSFAFEGATK